MIGNLWSDNNFDAFVDKEVLATYAGYEHTMSAALTRLLTHSSIFRVADPNFVSGAGAFLYFATGAFLAATSRSTMAEFRRARVFAGEAQQSDDLAHAPDEEALAPA